MVNILKNVRPYGGELTDVTIKDGKILSLAKTDDTGEDCGGAYLFPGLIEIHAHGCMGDDTMDGTIACFHGFAMCIDGYEEKGTLYGRGVYEKGDVLKRPELMTIAYEMGNSIR